MFSAERLLIAINFAMVMASIFLINFKGIEVDVASYVAPTIMVGVFVAVGLFYRFVRSDDKISSVTLAIGLFAFSSLIISHYSQLVLPLRFGPFDAYFVQMDAMLGFSWPEVMAFAAQYPLAISVLDQVYNLALAYVLFALLIVGMLTGPERLHQLIMSLTIAAIATILIWSAIPGAGASAYWTLPADVEKAINPTVDTAYGRKLLGLYQTGFSYIDNLSLKGLVGFPSFHIVMYIIPAVFLAGYRIIRWPVLIFCALGVPAIVVHGGHHLVDVLAGILISVLSIVAARKLIVAANNATAYQGASAIPTPAK